MSKRFLMFLIGVSLFALFVFYSYLVHKVGFRQFDFNTTVRLQDHIPRRFDSFFSVFSLIGSFEIISVFLVVLLILIRKIRGIIVLGLYVSIHFFELFGKIFVDHPGPPFMFLRYNIQFLFPSSYVQTGNSYPSGHSARAAFVSAVVLFVLLRSKKFSAAQKAIASIIIIVFSLTMFTSRVYLGEHWATDVIGGAFLGFALGCIGLIAL